MNELEAQLRSWKPRRPSAKVSRALFGRDVTAAAARPAAASAPDSTLTFSLHWLAPATAALALAWAVFHQPGSATFTGRSAPGPVMAVILSNQSLGSVLLEASNREPATPANYRSFELHGHGLIPNASGVIATSAVSTGASERLPAWGPKLQGPDAGSRDYPLTNGTGLPPQADASTAADSRLCAEHQPERPLNAIMPALLLPQPPFTKAPPGERVRLADSTEESCTPYAEKLALILPLPGERAGVRGNSRGLRSLTRLPVVMCLNSSVRGDPLGTCARPDSPGTRTTDFPPATRPIGLGRLIPLSLAPC
jgi:hypothetical protein